MAENIIVTEKIRNKEGALVVPLDEVRTVDFATRVFISGEYPGSGLLFPTLGSGRAISYLRQAIVTNLSGIYPIRLKWGDAAVCLSGNPAAKCVELYITSGTTVFEGYTHIRTFIPALGPYLSGIGIVSGGAQLGGTATAVMTADPGVFE